MDKDKRKNRKTKIERQKKKERRGKKYSVIKERQRDGKIATER